jgi:hypothetical protein
MIPAQAAALQQQPQLVSPTHMRADGQSLATAELGNSSPRQGRASAAGWVESPAPLVGEATATEATPALKKAAKRQQRNGRLYGRAPLAILQYRAARAYPGSAYFPPSASAFAPQAPRGDYWRVN